MVRQVCKDCGIEFEREPSETWRKRCFPCWHVWKFGTEPVPFEALELRDQVQRLEGALEQKAAVVDEVKARLRELIGLVHPDKHGGAQRAHELTVWLLELREKLE